MELFHINREERHFGFLFLAGMLGNCDFRKTVFERINSRFSLDLNPEDFDIYAEPAIFRDYWNSLGSHTQYDDALHQKRLEVLNGILASMGLDQQLVNEEDMFWTGAIDKSKLWYPGKWARSRIDAIEAAREIHDRRLWRCRWLCNAKPDVMIHSGSHFLFIEIKLESGMGGSHTGYDQEQTQDDIIRVGQDVIASMHESKIARITLTQIPASNGLTWDEVIGLYSANQAPNNAGAAMIERHFAHMPRKAKP